MLFKADLVFDGYWNNEAATAEAIDTDGWFHTGDIGEIDSDGFVSITGRKKELIVTAGGKNVAPAVLEDRVRAHWLISQCLVVGDRQPFIAALITVDPEAFPSWLEQTGRPASTELASLVEDERAARGGPERHRRREQGGEPRGGDPEVHHPAGRLDRGHRPAHAVVEAQAQHGADRVR